LKLEKKEGFLLKKKQEEITRKFCKSKIIYFEHRSLLYLDKDDKK